MKRLTLLLVVFCAGAISLFAQDSPKPYHDGPVWQIQYIHAKPGMEDRYLRYLSGDWKQEMEMMKKNGFILDYKVITTESHNPQDFNVILMAEYKDLATMEGNKDKAEAAALQHFGGRQKIESGYEDRSSYRDALATRVGREIILEPKK